VYSIVTTSVEVAVLMVDVKSRFMTQVFKYTAREAIKFLHAESLYEADTKYPVNGCPTTGDATGDAAGDLTGAITGDDDEIHAESKVIVEMPLLDS
jgi:hypothetical protein